MNTFYCVFRDDTGRVCGKVNVEAASSEAVEHWAIALISPPPALAKGVEIWRGEDRLASIGTAFRPRRTKAPRRTNKRRAPTGMTVSSTHRAAGNSRIGRHWFHDIVRRIWP